MSDIIVTVENLSKRYLIGHISGAGEVYQYKALCDVLGREARNFVRGTGRSGR
jgi:lipopolysaccharide transport system ATP-binding protein